MNAAIVAGEVARALGRAPDAVELIPTNERNEVYRLRLGDRAAFFKTHGADDIAIEAWAYERARSVGIPAPAVLAVDLSAARVPAPYVIVEEARGVPLSSLAGEPMANGLHGLGRCLRALHSIEIDGFGWIDREHLRATGEARAKGRSEREQIERDPWGLGYLVERGFLDPDEGEGIRAWILARTAAFDGAVSRLLHADLGTDHVFADPATGAVTAIIDWGDCRSGDPVWEFACMAIWERDRLPLVLASYGPDDPAFDAKLDVCVLVRLLGEARWMHERDMAIENGVRRIRAAFSR